MRTRAEAVAGQLRPGFVQDEMILAFRTTVRAEIGTGPVKFVGELFDSRVYGAVEGSVLSTSDVNALEPVQAYVEADLGKATLSAGRMMLNIGSRRLVAADDYRNTTNGYTGLKLDIGDPKGANATLIAVLPQQRRPDDFDALSRNSVALDFEGFDQQLWGGVGALPLRRPNMKLEVTAFGFRERDRPNRPTRNRELLTFGARLIRPPKAGQVDGEVEAFVQTGNIRASLAPAAATLDVAAWFLHADIGYSWDRPVRAKLSLEFDHASGDDRGPTYRRFDTLFGMRRADLGPAGLYNVIGRTNLSTIGARGEVGLSAKTTATLVPRALWAASATDSFSTTGIRDPSGASGRFAGYQLEGRLAHAIVPGRLQAEVNAVLLARRGLLQTAPNAPPGRTMRYLAVSLNTQF